MNDIDQGKDALRRQVWRLLLQRQASIGDPTGGIPRFHGADRAGLLLSGLPEWRAAHTLKSNPDWAQLDVRVRALREGKTVYMAVPRIAGEQPFYRLDPAELMVEPEEAADPAIAERHCPRVAVSDIPHIDLVICGSVAVNRNGARLGKGAGYSDIEVALLIEADLITDTTRIIATVHELQLIEEAIPETDHDFRADLIVTPHEVIRCAPSQRPRGLSWPDLSDEKIASIPALSHHPDRPT